MKNQKEDRRIAELKKALERCRDKCTQYYNANNLCDEEIHAAFGWIFDRANTALQTLEKTDSGDEQKIWTTEQFIESTRIRCCGNCKYYQPYSFGHHGDCIIDKMRQKSYQPKCENWEQHE